MEKFIKCRISSLMKSNRHCHNHCQGLIKDNVNNTMKAGKYHRKEDMIIYINNKWRVRGVSSHMKFDSIKNKVGKLPRYQYMWVIFMHDDKNVSCHTAGIVVDNKNKLFKVFDPSGNNIMKTDITYEEILRWHFDYKCKMIIKNTIQTHKSDSFCMTYVASWFYSIATRTETKYLERIKPKYNVKKRLQYCCDFYNKMIDEFYE